MDGITLTGIEVWANHGVLPHEEDLGQRFVLDVHVEVDLAAAGETDDLADTVDYGALAAVVVAAAGRPRLRLVEAVAARVVDAVLDHDERIAAVELTLHKPNAPLTVPVADVAIHLRRTRP